MEDAGNGDGHDSRGEGEIAGKKSVGRGGRCVRLLAGCLIV